MVLREIRLAKIVVYYCSIYLYSLWKKRSVLLIMSNLYFVYDIYNL